MDSPALSAVHRVIVSLAGRLKNAQDLADNGLYIEGFGYLEGAVTVALETLDQALVILEGDEAGGSAEVELPAYDAADVWRGVESHPLFPVDR